MPKLSLEFLESMIIRSCNLSCEGCTTFSDLKWSGYIPWEQGKEWIEPWTKRLEIQSWGVMGGEPLMNPDLPQWLEGIRKLLPEAQIRIVTNGLLLDKHQWIIDTLHDLGNSILKISYHLPDERVDANIDQIMNRFDWKPVHEFGIDRWLSDREFRFQVSRPTQFLKTFQGPYNDMRPHDNTPSDAFEICVQKRCPMLWNGRIYKCGTVGLMPSLLERFNWPNLDQWQPYIDAGISPECSDQELESFVTNFGRPHRLCRQCPSTKDLSSLIDHTITVKRK